MEQNSESRNKSLLDFLVGKINKDFHHLRHDIFPGRVCGYDLKVHRMLHSISRPPGNLDWQLHTGFPHHPQHLVQSQAQKRHSIPSVCLGSVGVSISILATQTLFPATFASLLIRKPYCNNEKYQCFEMQVQNQGLNRLMCSGIPAAPHPVVHGIQFLLWLRWTSFHPVKCSRLKVANPEF